MSLVSQQNIIDAIYAKILASIGSDLGNRVYELEAVQDADLPLCIYTVAGDTPEYHMNGESLDCDVQVQLFGWKKNGSKALRTITDTLIEAIDRKQINITGYDNEICFITNRGVITSEQDVIEIRIEFNIRGF